MISSLLKDANAGELALVLKDLAQVTDVQQLIKTDSTQVMEWLEMKHHLFTI